MWIITPLGFFSIVQKPSDVPAGTLTVRARVRNDLEALQAAVLPGLGAITESKSTDYRFRATAQRSLVEAAMAQLTALREVLEETGFTCRVIGALTKAYKASTPSTSAFFLMEPVGAQGKLGYETTQTKWVDLEEARMLISLTTKPTGVVRDLAILDDAMAAMASIKAAGEPSERYSA
jgi:8-oxo-dGTP pyrophosphatase MutT (NUDIX family)